MKLNYKKFNLFFIIMIITIVLSIFSLSYYLYYSILVNSPNIESDIYCKDCNIILISVDTLRSDHLNCYGYTKNTSSNICSLANKGILFENFIVHGYLTPVSMMSIMTSEYPSNNGIISFISDLKPSKKTLASILKENNYKTAAFGSSFELMTNFNFNETQRHAIMNVSTYFRKGFDTFKYTGNRNIPTDALTWLNDVNNTNKKFFLWLTLGTVHWPYALQGEPEEKIIFDPENYTGIFKSNSIIGGDILYRIYNNTYYNINGTNLTLTKKDKEYIISKYDFGIYYTDKFIGELLNEITNLGLQKKTIIIFSGIHGEDLGEHGYFTHYNIYDTEVKVPLIIYNPSFKEIKRIDSQVRGIDLSPTVLDLVGINSVSDFNGVSLISIIKNDDKNLTAFIERVPLWEDISADTFFPKDFFIKYGHIFRGKDFNYGDVGIRKDGWKLIHIRNWELEEKTSV